MLSKVGKWCVKGAVVVGKSVVKVPVTTGKAIVGSATGALIGAVLMPAVWMKEVGLPGDWRGTLKGFR